MNKNLVFKFLKMYFNELKDLLYLNNVIYNGINFFVIISINNMECLLFAYNF